MRFKYSRNYLPPAPHAEITLIGTSHNLTVGPFPAFLDTGADGTIVPARYAIGVRAPKTDEMYIRSQWGERRVIFLYMMDIQMGDIILHDVEVVGDDLSEEVIIGRDILNLLHLHLDGPAETTEISE